MFIFKKLISLFFKPILMGCLLVVSLQAQSANQLGVTVTILPLKSMVEEIGGEHVKVNVMVPPGMHPRAFEPTPKKMALLESSAIYISMGIPHEKNWVEQVKATRPDMPIINMIDYVETIQRNGGNKIDPHIWLGPQQLRTMAQHLTDTLIKLDPEHKADFIQNSQAWVARLDAVDKEAEKRLAPYKGRAFLVFHPAYGYLAEAYGLRQVSIEKKGMAPGPRMMAAAIKTAQSENINTIFIQKGYSLDEAKAIASEINAKVVTLDPLAPDLIAGLAHKVKAIEASFQ